MPAYGQTQSTLAMMHPHCTDTGAGHNHTLILLRFPKSDLTNREMVTVYTTVRYGTLTNANTAKCLRVTCIVDQLDIVSLETLVSISERGMNLQQLIMRGAKIRIIIFEAPPQHV